MPKVVLVVEDEPLIRMAAADMFEDAGFEALEAADASQAILLLESRHDIVLLFTDVDMPGSMDGIQLAEHVRDRWPPIGLFIVSGHRSLSEECLPVGAAFLTKPYTDEAVLQIVKQLAA